MKLIKIALPLLMVLMILSGFSLKKGEKAVYAFGLSASFTDTVVFYTEVQVLDSVKLDKGFLPQRDLYSYQLKNYLEYQKGETKRTCMIYFSENKAKLMKERSSILNKYKKKQSVALREITKDEFTFKKPEE